MNPVVPAVGAQCPDAKNSQQSNCKSIILSNVFVMLVVCSLRSDATKTIIIQMKTNIVSNVCGYAGGLLAAL